MDMNTTPSNSAGTNSPVEEAGTQAAAPVPVVAEAPVAAQAAAAHNFGGHPVAALAHMALGESAPAPVAVVGPQNDMFTNWPLLTAQERVTPATDTHAYEFVEAYAAANIAGVCDHGAARPTLLRYQSPRLGLDIEWAVEFRLGRHMRRYLKRVFIGGDGGKSTKRLRVYLSVDSAAKSRIVGVIHPLEDDVVLFNHERAVVVDTDILDLRLEASADGVFIVQYDRVQPFGVRSFRLCDALPADNIFRARYGADGSPSNEMPGGNPVAPRQAFACGMYLHRYVEAYAAMHIERVKAFGFHKPRFGSVLNGGTAEFAAEFVVKW